MMIEKLHYACINLFWQEIFHCNLYDLSDFACTKCFLDDLINFQISSLSNLKQNYYASFKYICIHIHINICISLALRALL